VSTLFFKVHVSVMQIYLHLDHSCAYTHKAWVSVGTGPSHACNVDQLLQILAWGRCIVATGQWQHNYSFVLRDTPCFNLTLFLRSHVIDPQQSKRHKQPRWRLHHFDWWDGNPELDGFWNGTLGNSVVECTPWCRMGWVRGSLYILLIPRLYVGGLTRNQIQIKEN
jgi:hypothetical protein